MAGKKISELDLITNVDGTEAFPVAKGGVNYRMTVAMILNWIGNATQTVAGLLSPNDKKKLDGVATGATANSPDANLRDRATHTGTQSVSTITGLGRAATTNQYADLSGKPDLSPAGLGAAPDTHVGASGDGAHPEATSSLSGFMSPEQFQTIAALKAVATSGAYADLTGRPTIPANLEDLADVTAAGAADGQVLTKQNGKWVASTPASGGSGGTSGSSTLAGLSDATIASPRDDDHLMYSGAAGKWKNTPFSRLFMGYRWYVDSNSSAGTSINDYHTIGTASYVAIAASGTDFKSHHAYSSFLSSASTYSAAGTTSADPVVKHGTGSQGGFVYEAIVSFDWLASSCGFFGLSASRSQTYGSFSSTDVGIGIGWNGGNVGTDPLSIIVGNGSASATVQAASGHLSDAATYRIKITLAPGGTQAYVTLKNLDTGAYIFDNQMVNMDLPAAATPLYAFTGVGNTSVANSVTVRVFGVAADALIPA